MVRLQKGQVKFSWGRAKKGDNKWEKPVSANISGFENLPPEARRDKNRQIFDINQRQRHREKAGCES